MKKPKKKSSSFSWPNDARVAVVMTCLWENWSDGKGPPFSVQTTALRPGTHDRAAMTWGTYGGRAGVWRLIKILDDNKVPGTFVANARALELAPAAAKQAIKSGHEIPAHSYTPGCPARLSRSEGRKSADQPLRRHPPENYRQPAERLVIARRVANRAH